MSNQIFALNKKAMAALVAGLAIGLAGAGCTKKAEDSGENAQEAVGNAAEETGETMEEGAEDTGEAVEDAAEETEEAVQ